MSDAVLSQFKQEEVKEEIKAPAKKIKVGIIGTGGISNGHLRAYLKQNDIEIIAACDIVPGKAKMRMEQYGLNEVRCYENHKEMLDSEPELDVVSVCTYNTQHAPCAIDALEHGLNVLLEKPFTVTLEEAIEVMKAEKRTGKFVSVGFQPRFDKNMQMIKKIVESGTLGEIYYIQTGGGRRRGIPGGTFITKHEGGIGALGDIGCYSLDMVMNAIGHPKPLTVSGYISDFFGTRPEGYHYDYALAKKFEVDDFAAGFIRLEGGIILDFRISWAMHADTPGDTIIFGKEGALRIPSTDCWNGSVGGEMTLYHDFCGKQTETKIPLMEETDLWYQKIRYFLDAAKENGKAPVPTSEIIYNQAILSGIVKSAELGREIEIEIPEI